VRLREKDEKRQQAPTHHKLETYSDICINAAGIANQAKAAGLPCLMCCHTFQVSGRATFLENRETMKDTQAIAAHESPRTTKRYDWTGGKTTLDEIERIIN
jgi:hypothetical protein